MPNVLVVDDEPDVLDALDRALRLAGHNVTKAGDAATAIEAARERPFDLVVLDYIMPSMTGIELLNRIRVFHPMVRSMIVSGKIDTQISEESVAAELRDSIEADMYLHKPIENDKLLAAIKQLLDGSDHRDWKDVASRHVRARKPSASIRNAEKQIGRHRNKKRR